MGRKLQSIILNRKDIIFAFLLLLAFIPRASGRLEDVGRGRRNFGSRRSALLEDEKSPTANLLFDKKFLSEVFALGWKVEIQYQLHNIGDEMALDVHILDEEFESENSKFNVTQGQAEFRISRIMPGENVTLKMTAVPNIRMQLGSFQFQSAKVTYRSSSREILDDDIVGWSSLSPFNRGNVVILSKLEADSRYSSKWFELLVLILICLPPVAVPLAMWKSHTVKYDELQKLSEAIRMSKTKRGKAKLHTPIM